METLSIFHIKVLHILAARYGLSYTLEELTSLLTPVINAKAIYIKNMPSENEKQAVVLEVLLVLHNAGHVFLNSNTDKSSITIKGLILSTSKTICN
jgi:hypothetical protein